MSDADDTRVLNMRINNKEFLKGTGDSLKALDTLNKGIDGAGKGKGLQSMSKNVDTVKTRFGALQIAGVTALATITNKAVNAGLNLVKSLTIAPILGGFREYEKLLTSTQTIMANTGKSTEEVGKYLDQLNHYSDQTIYNFGQMADNIGRFTAAGVGLKDSTDSIKGLANAAALSGSTTEQLNTAMYQVSQALSAGSIKLMDWNSLANAGLGGKNIRESLMATARTLGDNGKAMDASIAKYGSFRESLRSGWLEADVFTKTMKVFAGESRLAGFSVEKLKKAGYDPLAISAIKAGKTVAFSVKQLQKMGYSRKAAEDLNRLSQASIDSATKIKTFSQLMDVVKESIESGWAGIFRRIFGDLEQSGKLWTKVGDTITTAIGTVFTAIDNMLIQWGKLGGYEKLWGGLGNIFKSIGNILRPFVGLFTAMLPGADNAGKSLYGLTAAFYQFSVWLEKVTSGTAVLNPAIDLLGSIVGAVFGAFKDLLMLFAPLGRSILDLAASIEVATGNLGSLSGFSGGISKLFETFNQARLAVLEPFVVALTQVIDSFRALIGGDLDPKGFGEAIRSAFANLGSDLIDLFDTGKQAGADLIAGLREGISGGGGDIKATISDWVNGFVDFFKGLLGINSPSTVFAEFGNNIVQGLVQGITSAASAVGGAVKDLFGFMKDQFSEIDKFDLANLVSVIFGGAVFLTIRRFLNAISGAFEGFGQFGANLNNIMEQTTSTMKTFQTGIKAKAIMRIAIAIGILAASLWVLSKIPADKLAIGLGAVGTMLAGLTATMAIMAKNAAQTTTAVASMTAMAFGMTLMATAVLILSAAVLAFGNMDTDTLVKGITSITVVLGLLSGAAILLSKAAPSFILASGALVILSFGMLTMLGAILAFSKIDQETLGNGLLKIAAVFVAFAAAATLLSSGAGNMLLASVALGVLSVAMMGILGAILAFAQVDWGTFGKGLGMIATSILLLGLAGYAAAPGLTALGVAGLFIGGALFLIGAGLALAGIGLAAIAAAGTAAAAILVTAISGFLSLLPVLAVQLVAALRTAVEALAQASPDIVDGLITIATELLRGFDKIAAQVSESIIKLLMLVLDAIVEHTPTIVGAMNDIVVGILEALTEDADQMIQAGTDLAVAIITGIGEGSVEIVNAAGQMILDFLTAMNLAVETYGPQISEQGRLLAWNILQGIVTGLVPQPVLDAINSLVDRFVDWFKGLLGINSPSTLFKGFGGDIVRGLAQGIISLISNATQAAGRLGSQVVSAVTKWLSGLPGKAKSSLASLGGTLKSTFGNAFRTAVDEVTKAGRNIGTAIGKLPGIIRDKISSVSTAAKALGKSILNGIGSGIGSAGNWVKDLAGDIKRSVNNGLGLPKRVGIKFKKGPINIDSGITIPAFAKGVSGFGGGAALVGEKGPEIVTMGRGSNVITNENLVMFIKKVGALTKSLSAGVQAKKSPEGTIQYVVSADFRGDPKSSGVAFAANIAAGLINGLKANQSNVTSGMAGMATSLSTAFADVLEIRSPSRVFERYAGFVGAGFIKGLLYSVSEVKKAASAIGEAAILAIAKTVTDGQLQLEAVRAKANAYSDAADELRAKARRTKSKKERKRLEAEAKKLDAQAKKQAAAVAAQAKKVADENAAAERAEQFEAADTAGKSTMKKEDAAAAAEAASRAREQSIRLSKEADLIRRRDKKRAAELDKQAKAALERAKILADRSEKYALEAYTLSEKAKAEIAAEEAARVAEEKAKADAEAAEKAAEEKEALDKELEEQRIQIQSVSDEDVARAQAAFDYYTKQLEEALVAAAADSGGSKEIKFEQHNYSPEALSAADSYRNGKSLISMAERKLSETG